MDQLSYIQAHTQALAQLKQMKERLDRYRLRDDHNSAAVVAQEISITKFASYIIEAQSIISTLLDDNKTAYARGFSAGRKERENHQYRASWHRDIDKLREILSPTVIELMHRKHRSKEYIRQITIQKAKEQYDF